MLKKKFHLEDWAMQIVSNREEFVTQEAVKITLQQNCLLFWDLKDKNLLLFLNKVITKFLWDLCLKDVL